MTLDPRTRLLLIILITTLAVLAKDTVYLAVVCIGAVIINLALRLDILSTLKRLKYFFTLIVFIALVQSLTVKGGTPLIKIGGFVLLSTKGIIFAAEFMLRMSIILFAGLIASSANGREMTDGLLKLGMPYEFAFMSAITLRFLPVFRAEFASRINALSLRGIDIKRLPLGKKLKLYGYLIAPVISSCVLKSEALALAMTARGFGANPKRTMLRELRLTYKDWLVIILSLLLTAAYLSFMYSYGLIISI